MDFGTRSMCETRLAKMTNAFSEERLSRYGLHRDAETFNDFIRDGTNSLEKYRKALESELKVDSVIPFIAAKAKREVDEALEELKAFIRDVTNYMPGGTSAHEMTFNAEDIRLNEDGKVVLTKVGNDKLDELTGYYLSSKNQVDIWNLATEIKEKFERLHKMVGECSGNRFGANHVIDINNGTATINTMTVTSL